MEVRAAMASPPGTETVSATGRSVTSPTAARIMRAGTGLMAGAPTGRPRPGRVTVPTPGPACSSTVPAARSAGSQAAVTVMWAPWVTSGSSPASLTTAARPGWPVPGRRRPRRNGPAGPRASPPPPRPAGRPGAGPMTAALAAAEAQVPVVQPVRSPLAPATSGARGGSCGGRGRFTGGGPTAGLRWSPGRDGSR